MKLQKLFIIAVAFFGTVSCIQEPLVTSNTKKLDFSLQKSSKITFAGTATAEALSPDGSKLAVGFVDSSFYHPRGPNPIDIFNTQLGGSNTIELQGHQGKGEICLVTFSPDGKKLASALPNEIKIWNLETAGLIYTAAGDYNILSDSAHAFSPDGSKFAIASNPKELTIHNIAIADKEKITIKSEKPITSIAFSPDGKTLAISLLYGEIRILSIEGEGEIEFKKSLQSTLDDWVGSTLFFPDGERIARASRNQIEILNITTEKFTKIHESNQSPLESVGIFSLALSPDGTVLAGTSFERKVTFWNALTGDHLATLSDTESIKRVAFSSDGKTLTMLLDNNTIKLWEISTRSTAWYKLFGAALSTVAALTAYSYRASLAPLWSRVTSLFSRPVARY